MPFCFIVSKPKEANVDSGVELRFADINAVGDLTQPSLHLQKDAHRRRDHLNIQ